MDLIQNDIYFINSLNLRTQSTEDIPVITPCSNLINAKYVFNGCNQNIFTTALFSIKVYSDLDGTFITFPLKNRNTSINDLKNHLFSLKEFKRIRHASLDSQASTVDSHNSLTNINDIDSLFDYKIQIYCVISGNLKKEFLDNTEILSILNEFPETKFYYSISSNSLTDDNNELIVIVYPKINTTDINIKCSIEIKESGLLFFFSEKQNINKKAIFININDISSITIYKQIDNCLLIKRKNINKNPILFRTRSNSEFHVIKERLKEVFEMLTDSRLISEADNRISYQKKSKNSIEAIIKLNKLTNLYEFLNSTDKIAKNKVLTKHVHKKIELESSNIVLTLNQLKSSLMNQEKNLIDLEENNLEWNLKKYFEEPLSIEDFLQVN